MVALREPVYPEPGQPESLTKRRLRRKEGMKMAALVAALAWKRESDMLPLWEQLMQFREAQPRPQHGGRCPTCRCEPRHRTCARCERCRELTMRSTG